MRDETDGFPGLHSPVVTLSPDLARVVVPAGWGDRAALSALRPDLIRALAPPLPPAEQWPEHWREAFDERVAIAAEGGAADPEAVAVADLRVMLWRELAEEHREDLERQEQPAERLETAEQVSASAA